MENLENSDHTKRTIRIIIRCFTEIVFELAKYDLEKADMFKKKLIVNLIDNSLHREGDYNFTELGLTDHYAIMRFEMICVLMRTILHAPAE